MKKRATIITTMFAATALWAGMAHAIGTIQLPRTGQGEAATCWNAAGTSVPCATTGQDGESRKGVALPSPRFTAPGNGTVTDNLTGLIWLQNANCWGPKLQATALTLANGLASGQCGLTDGSTAGQWRLPNIKELESLIDINQKTPALTPGHQFLNLVLDCGVYVSSTYDNGYNPYSGNFIIDLNDGSVGSWSPGTLCGAQSSNDRNVYTLLVR